MLGVVTGTSENTSAEYGLNIAEMCTPEPRSNNAAPLSNWKNHDAYQQSFEKPLKALKITD